jgi:predicted AAA+ superfamily ATPase
MFDRWFAGMLREKLSRPYVHLVFGARQTGKSTLLRSLLPPETLVVNLADPRERTRHLADPGALLDLCRTLAADQQGRFVFVDEAQAVPSVFDAVQHLYDNDKLRWRFVLCGSSARKLRRIGANLLPGRSFYHRLLPLTLAEHPANEPPIPYAVSPLPFAWGEGHPHTKPFPAEDLLTRLAYGDLPGVVAAPEPDRAEMLRAFAFVHLEEEIRREALVKDWGAFVRFLQLAAAESGQIVNFAAISQESGVSQPTVKSHYQLLEDMFVGFRVEAFSRSRRKALLSTPKFLFFDLGVRHAAAGLTTSRDVVLVNPGAFFEQWVGIELWKRLQYLGEGRLFHLRTKDGAEVDFIIERAGTLTPIEVKWTERPAVQDARRLLTFLAEHPKQAKHGYIVCRCSAPLRLHDQITALPWFCL